MWNTSLTFVMLQTANYRANARQVPNDSCASHRPRHSGTILVFSAANVMKVA